MQSKREQVHSYQFFMHRVISGLVARESDPAELPFRRLGGAALGSVMVAVLALAAIGVYGLVAGGGATSWRDGTFVIVERETGTRYVYRDERLHPVVNLASAWLLLEQHADVKLVSAKSLVGVPRGPMLGIPGAPEGLPGPDRLLTGGWTFCSQLSPDSAGGRVAESVLGAGVRPDGGAELDNAAALLVRDADAESGLTLLWNGHRFAITDADPVLRALGTTEDRALPVAGAWLEALPAAQDLRGPDVPGRGAATTALSSDPAVRTGQVIEAPPGTYYLVQRGALTPITPLLKDIILADPVTAEAYQDGAPRVVTLGTQALANADIEAAPAPTETAPPADRPALISPDAAEFRDGAVCLTYGSGSLAPSINVGGRLMTEPTMATARFTDDGVRLADRVHVPPGWAALVEARSAPEAADGSLHLVTDQGIRYGLPGAAVAGMLGYDPGRAVLVPASLLDRLPSGPALDPATARQPAIAL